MKNVRRISADSVWWATTLRIADSVCSKTLFCAGDLQHSKWTPGGMVCVLANHAMETMRWMCKSQVAVYKAARNPRLFCLVLVHERMAPLLKTLVECGSETILRKSVKGDLEHQRPGPHDSSPVNVNELDPKSIGRVPTNIPHFSSRVQLRIFADGAAAIHMVIKDRSLHVPAAFTFTVCLSESICDRTISIRYAQTTDRMAEMLTQGAPTSAR